ncbi:hypothetical protein MHK_003113 [Candidatus Magnetomorum sp. HK-1]|nr:hypothetical protein MHK_003113 [Candidatus Magnetomorum sp. HK-1]
MESFVEIVLNDIVIGHKNINCPDYEKCLNEQSSINSNFWICNGCNRENVFKNRNDEILQVMLAQML